MNNDLYTGSLKNVAVANRPLRPLEIVLCDPAKAHTLELCNSWRARFLRERLYLQSSHCDVPTHVEVVSFFPRSRLYDAFVSGEVGNSSTRASRVDQGSGPKMGGYSCSLKNTALYSHSPKSPALHCNSSKSVPNRPLRGRRGRFGTLLQQLE